MSEAFEGEGGVGENIPTPPRVALHREAAILRFQERHQPQNESLG